MADNDALTADFATKFPDSFARALSRGSAAEVSGILTRLPAPSKAAIVARLPAAQIDALLQSEQHSPAQWLADASFDDAITLLSRIPREQRLSIVNSLAQRERRHRLLQAQRYPPHSLGALVEDVRLRIRVDTPAAEVLTQLRRSGGDEPRRVVIVDDAGRYFGLLNLWLLMTRDPPTGTVGDYARGVAPVYPETPILSALEDEDWLDQNWLPMVDHRQRVLGVVSRARVLVTARKFQSQHRSSGNLILDLFSDLVSVLVALLDRLLVPGSTR